MEKGGAVCKICGRQVCTKSTIFFQIRAIRTIQLTLFQNAYDSNLKLDDRGSICGDVRRCLSSSCALLHFVRRVGRQAL